MKIITQIILLLFLTFIANAQNKEIIIWDACSTETSTPIHSSFMFPFKVKIKVEKQKLRTNYRPLYKYHLIPLSNEYKKNEIELFMDYHFLPDSTVNHLILTFDEYKAVPNYENMFYNETYLITFKSFTYHGHKYNFLLKVKHNQKRDDFDIKTISWFLDIVKSWKLIHGINVE